MVKDTEGGGVMDLRDQIAIEAMKSILVGAGDNFCHKGIAILSYQMADAMLKKREHKNKNESLSLDSLDLTVYTANVLNDNNIKTLDDLLSKNRIDLIRLPRCGHKTIKEIMQALKRFNLSLAV